TGAGGELLVPHRWGSREGHGRELLAAGGVEEPAELAPQGLGERGEDVNALAEERDGEVIGRPSGRPLADRDLVTHPVRGQLDHREVDRARGGVEGAVRGRLLVDVEESAEVAARGEGTAAVLEGVPIGRVAERVRARDLRCRR